MKTTVSVEDGKTILLGGMVHETGKLRRKLIVLLQPEIVHTAP